MSEMKVKFMIAMSVLGKIEDRISIIDAFYDSDTTNLFLVDLLTGTKFFIWKRTFGTYFAYNPMFPDLHADPPKFLKESVNEIIKTFKCKSLKEIAEVKILEKGISSSEDGLPLPYIKAIYRDDGNRSIFFGTNFTYIDDEGFFSEIILIAMNEENKYNQEEIQNIVYGILREDPQLTKETDEAIRNLQNEKNDLKTRKDAIRSLRKIGSNKAIDAIITALKDKNREIRKEAASVLGRLRGKRVVEALCSALKDEDKEVRKTAVLSLLEIGSMKAVDPLINILKDECKAIRLVAVPTLGRIKDKRAVEPLIEVLKRDEDEFVRGVAAMALSGFGDDKRVVDSLITALKDESVIVRRNAANTLGRVGDKSVIPKLTPLLKDEDETVRKKAKKAIEEIKTRIKQE
jgi:hypothetical protein